MADEVGEVGKGYFSAKGKLKTDQELSQEAKAAQKKSDSNSAKESDFVVSTDFSERSKEAFKSVASKFNAQVNEISGVINENEEKLSKAEKIVKEQISTAKELKTAIREEDADKEAEARERLKELDDERKKLAKEVEKSNDENSTRRSQNLSLGNKQKGKVEVDAVEFKAQDPQELSSKDDVDQFIVQLRADKASIDEQQDDLKETKKDLKLTVRETRSELSDIEEQSLKSYEDAQKKADDIAQRLRSGGQEVALNTISTKISEAVVRSLFQ